MLQQFCTVRWVRCSFLSVRFSHELCLDGCRLSCARAVLLQWIAVWSLTAELCRLLTTYSRNFLHVDTGFKCWQVAGPASSCLFGAGLGRIEISGSWTDFGKAWLSVYSMIIWGAVCQRARQPVPGIYADIVQVEPPLTEHWAFFMLIMCRPLQQGPISSVVRAMVLWAIGRGLNPRMEYMLLPVPVPQHVWLGFGVKGTARPACTLKRVKWGPLLVNSLGGLDNHPKTAR